MEEFCSELRRLSPGDIARLKKTIAENKSEAEGRRNKENAEAEKYLKQSFQAVAEKKYHDAELNLKYAVSQFPENSMLAFNLGNIFFSVGKNAEAEKWYFRALKLSPLCYLAYINLGILYVSESKLRAAEKCFEKAVLVDNSNPAAYINLANIHRLQDSTEGAKRFYLRALEVDPGCADACLNLAGIYEENGEFDTAEQIYFLTMQKNQNNPALMSGLANVLYYKKEYARAIEITGKIKEIKLEFFDTYIILAKVHLALNDLSSAEQALHIASEVGAGDFRTHRWLGNLYTAKGQFSLAENAFRTALTLNNTDTETQNDFAKMLELSGRPKDALKLIKQEK